MALDTFEKVRGRVELQCPASGSLLAKQWVSHAFRQVAERRRWSWLIKYGQFVYPALYNTGTVTCTQGSTTIIGVGTAWTAPMVGRQIRVGLTNPIYTIASFTDPSTIDIEFPWGPPTMAGAGHEIYQAYQTTPADFHSFLTVYDPRFNWQLHLNFNQAEINQWDSQRANRGQPWMVVAYDYTTSTSAVPGIPRYELWPHVIGATVIPFLYESRIDDLEDGYVLPRYIRGDALLEMALCRAAAWPGTTTAANPYFDINLVRFHKAESERMLMDLERQDDEVNLQDMYYQTLWPMAPTPLGDSRWLQSHAV